MTEERPTDEEIVAEVLGRHGPGPTVYDAANRRVLIECRCGERFPDVVAHVASVVVDALRQAGRIVEDEPWCPVCPTRDEAVRGHVPNDHEVSCPHYVTFGEQPCECSRFGR